MMFVLPFQLMATSNFASFNKYDIAFKCGKTQEEVTCIQDAKNENLWYYISRKPKLAENQDGDPIINFVSYNKNSQFGIKNNGGILQCAINLTLSDEAIPILRKELAKTLEVQDNKITLSPLNIKKAKIMVYDLDGKLLGDYVTYPEIGTSFTNQSIAIQMTLNNLDASLQENILNGKGFLQVFYIFDYDCLTPESSTIITYNYDKAFDLFCHDSKTTLSAKNLFIGVSYPEKIISDIIEKMTLSEVLSVEQIGNDELTKELINSISEPIIDKLIKELYEISTPQKVQSLKTYNYNEFFENWTTTLTKSIDLRSDKIRKTGELKYNFKKRYIENKKISIGGIISLADYSEAQRRKSIYQAANSTYWKSLFYNLPYISKAISQIDEITLTLNLLYKGKQAEGTEQQLAKWTKKEGWVDKSGTKCIGFEFPLKYFYDKYSRDRKTFPKDLAYQQNFVVSYMEGNTTKIYKFSTKIPAFTDSIPINTPMFGATYVEFNADNYCLTWDKSEYENREYRGLKSNLSKIIINVESKNPTNKGNVILTRKTPTAGLWFANIQDKKTGLYKVPMISATYSFYNSKLAKSMNTVDKKTIIIENEDVLSNGSIITIRDDDYMPVVKPESY